MEREALSRKLHDGGHICETVGHKVPMNSPSHRRRTPGHKVWYSSPQANVLWYRIKISPDGLNTHSSQ